MQCIAQHGLYIALHWCHLYGILRALTIYWLCFEFIQVALSDVFVLAIFLHLEQQEKKKQI